MGEAILIVQKSNFMFLVFPGVRQFLLWFSSQHFNWYFSLGQIFLRSQLTSIAKFLLRNYGSSLAVRWGRVQPSENWHDKSSPDTVGLSSHWLRQSQTALWLAGNVNMIITWEHGNLTTDADLSIITRFISIQIRSLTLIWYDDVLHINDKHSIEKQILLAVISLVMKYLQHNLSR